MTTTTPQKRGPKFKDAGTHKKRLVVYLPPELYEWLTATTQPGRRSVANRIEAMIKAAQTDNK